MPKDKHDDLPDVLKNFKSNPGWEQQNVLKTPQIHLVQGEGVATYMISRDQDGNNKGEALIITVRANEGEPDLEEEDEKDE